MEYIERIKSVQCGIATSKNIKRVNKTIGIQLLHGEIVREKGCEYCKEHKSLNGNYDVSKIVIENKRLNVTYSDSFYDCGTSVEYCPKCGRKLEINE